MTAFGGYQIHRVLEVAFVVVGGGEHHEQGAAGGYRLVVVRHILGCDVAGDVGARGLDA